MATVTVDDRDSRIVYSGVWVLGGTSNEYDSTTTGSRMGYTGQTATFQFSGTSIAVYGTISSPAVSTYTVDGLLVSTFTAPDDNSNIQYKQRFFSTGLSANQHTLVITSIASDATVWIDYLEYTPIVSSSSSSSTTSITAAAPSPNAVGGTTAVSTVEHTVTATNGDNPTTSSDSTSSPVPPTTSSTNPLSSTASSTIAVVGFTQNSALAESTSSSSAGPSNSSTASSSSSNSHLSVIIGPVVGCVVLVLAILLLVSYLVCRRRRRGSASESGGGGELPGPTSMTPTPFMGEIPTTHHKTTPTPFNGEIASVITKHQTTASSSSRLHSSEADEAPPAYYDYTLAGKSGS